MATGTSLAQETEKAVTAHLKTAVAYSSVSIQQKEALDVAIELVSLSAGYVIYTIENPAGAIAGKGLAAYLRDKSLKMAKMIDFQPMQCMVAVAEFGISVAKDGPKLVVGIAATATGVAVLLAIQAGLSLLLQARDVWTHCAPLVREWVENMKRQHDLDTIFRQSKGKLAIYTLNYVPNAGIARTA